MRCGLCSRHHAQRILGETDSLFARVNDDVLLLIADEAIQHHRNEPGTSPVLP